MKRSGGDEEHMVSSNRTIPRHHDRAFNDRQEIALHTFVGDIAANIDVAADCFIDLIDKNDTRFFDPMNRFIDHGIDINKPVSFLLREDSPRILHRHAAAHRPGAA